MSAPGPAYYRILADDVRCADRWFLSEPLTEDGIEIDARDFRYGVRYTGPRPAYVPIQQQGKSVRFNLAAFDMPVCSSDVADVIQHFGADDIERFDVKIGLSLPGYEIINVACREACVDERRSDVMKWTPEDGRLDKVDTYRAIHNLRIDPKRTGAKHVFRILDWEVALIVSEQIKLALQSTRDLGVVFQPVT